VFSPLIHLKKFMQAPLQFMSDMHAQHGDFFALYLGHKKFHFIRHPDLIEHVLHSEAQKFQKSRLIFDKIKPITGENGLVQLEGSSWQEMRDKTGQVFNKTYLDRYINIIHDCTDEMVAQLHRDITQYSLVDMSSLAINNTINIAVRIFCGVEHDSDAEKIAENFIKLNALCGLRMRRILHYPSLFPGSLEDRIKRARSELDCIFTRLIADAKNASQHSLLAELNSSLRECPKKNILIKDQMMTFIFAGFETTAASLAFCLYLLGKHQNQQKLLRNEKKAGNNEYTTCVYREALRLYPPAYMLAREVTTSHVVHKVTLKKGDNIIISLFGAQRHPDFWTDSEDFLPQRFAKTNNVEQHRFSFLPFGYGKRVCSGMQLAMMEASIIIDKLISQFSFSSAENSNLQLDAMVTLHPGGPIHLKVESL
jgi:cytochrome P450